MDEQNSGTSGSDIIWTNKETTDGDLTWQRIMNNAVTEIQENPPTWRIPFEEMRKRPMYYNRDGTPIEGNEATLEWAKQFEDTKSRTVRLTITPYGERLSTVWMGLDHSFTQTGPPIIFETMLFAPEKYIEKHYPHDQLQERYSTEAQARAGHRRLKLQCLIPPGWRRFILYTIFKDAIWS